MAVTHKLYGAAMKNMLNNNITDLNSSGTTTLTFSLMTSEHSFAQGNEYWGTISANETSSGTAGSTNYAAQTLTTIALASSGDRLTLFDADDVTFTSTGNVLAYHGILRASSYLISSIDFDGEQKSVAGEFKLNFASTGVFTITVGA